MKQTGTVPKNAEKDFQGFSDAVSLSGRHLHLYSQDEVRNFQSDVKHCGRQYFNKIFQLKVDFEESAEKKMSSTIERVKNEIATKYTEAEAQSFIDICERRYLAYRDSSGKLDRFFDSFPFRESVQSNKV